MPDELSDTDIQAQYSWVDNCKPWDEWDKAGPPFRVHANTYYVGTCGIGAILIVGSDGHVLIDGGTASGADMISENIEALGFDIADVRILLHSHEHFDHVAGLGALQSLSGAALYASAAAAPVFRTGEAAPSDPQYGLHDPFPTARVDHIVHHGDIVRLGDITMTVIATPGHTSGALSWQWESCDRDGCQMIVYADSLSPVSADDYQFTDHPEALQAFRTSLERVAALDCAVLLTPHPSASGMRRRMQAGDLRDDRACARYAHAVSERLDTRLEKERADAR